MSDRDPTEVLARIFHDWDIKSYGGDSEIHFIHKRKAQMLMDELKAEDFEVIDTRDCVAQIHHGPGHQTISKCTKQGAHDVHECAPMGIVLEWRGDVGFTDPWDNPPYISE